MIRVLGSLVFLIALWQGVIWVFDLPRFLLPGPLLVAEAMWENRALLTKEASTTLLEVAIGIVLGTVLGAITALGLAASSWVRTLLGPIVVASQSVPVFALAPILTLWFGFGIESKIVMAVIIIFFPVTSTFLDGLLRTPPGWLDLARTMGASPWTVLWQIRIPAAIPSLASGLRLAAVYAPIGAVISEWIGSAGGLGYLMLLANGRSKTDLMFAALIVLAVITVLLHRGVGWACDRLEERMS